MSLAKGIPEAGDSIQALSELPPSPTDGSAGSSRGTRTGLAQNIGDHQQQQAQIQKSTKADGNPRRGRHNPDIHARKGNGQRSRRHYSRGAVGVKPDFSRTRHSTSLLIGTPPETIYFACDDGEDNHEPSAKVNGEAERQDGIVMNTNPKLVVSASRPPVAKESLTLEERMMQVLSDFEVSAIRVPAKTAIYGDIAG